MKSITSQEFAALTPAQQNNLIKASVQIVDAPVVDSSDLFAEVPAEVKGESAPHSEYSIEGDRIWLNLDIELNGHKLRLPSVEITSIYYAQRKAKGADDRIDVTEVMSLVKTIRQHGTEKVNTAMVVNARFGQQGEKQAEAVDLFA